MLNVHIRRSWAGMADEYFFWDQDRATESVYILHWDRATRAWLRDLVGTGGAVAIPADLEPTFLVPHNLSAPFAKALTEALSGEGFVSERHEGARAKLEAVTAHLEDMRKLAFEEPYDGPFAKELIDKLGGDLEHFRKRADDDAKEIARLNRVRETNECELRGLHQERREHLERIASLDSALSVKTASLAATTIAYNNLKRRLKKRR